MLRIEIKLGKMFDPFCTSRHQKDHAGSIAMTPTVEIPPVLPPNVIVGMSQQQGSCPVVPGAPQTVKSVTIVYQSISETLLQQARCRKWNTGPSHRLMIASE
jgi:hypothetical protein